MQVGTPQDSDRDGLSASQAYGAPAIGLDAKGNDRIWRGTKRMQAQGEVKTKAANQNTANAQQVRAREY